MHHPTDRIAHTTAFVTPVMEHWLEQEIAQWVNSSINPTVTYFSDLQEVYSGNRQGKIISLCPSNLKLTLRSGLGLV